VREPAGIQVFLSSFRATCADAGSAVDNTRSLAGYHPPGLKGFRGSGLRNGRPYVSRRLPPTLMLRGSVVGTSESFIHHPTNDRSWPFSASVITFTSVCYWLIYSNCCNCSFFINGVKINPSSTPETENGFE